MGPFRHARHCRVDDAVNTLRGFSVRMLQRRESYKIEDCRAAMAIE